MADPVPILARTGAAFVADAAAHGVRGPAALDLYRTAWRTGRIDAPWIDLDVAPIVRTLDEDGTIKFAQRLGDGLETESVVIPGRGSGGRDRTTLCVSSQVGCAMGCRFCETAQMGLRRHLDAAAILGQWFAARHGLGHRIDNVVFMGMGEPLDNLDAVAAAIRILADDNGPAVPPSRITVSTVGRTGGIDALADVAAEPGLKRLRLAVSVNAPDDAVRRRLMPIERAEPMPALRAAMDRWCARTGGRVLIEYVLIPGETDGAGAPASLAAYLDGLPCTVNVIPYNPRRDSPWPAPVDADVDRFVADLRAAGLRVTRRVTRGRTLMAACGQLGNPELRRR